MSILITGAAGFIGSHLADQLLGRGESVVGLDAFDPFYPRSLKERNLTKARGFAEFREVEGDFRERLVLDSLPDDVEAVVHLGALAGVRPSIQNPARYTSVNIGGTTEVLEFMRRRGITKLIFASSSSVYGNHVDVPFREDTSVLRPISPYAVTKVAGEMLSHAYFHLHGMSIVPLRFFTVYGPRQRPDLAIRKFATLMRRGLSIPMFGDGRTERDYTYVDDAVDGLLRALRFVNERSEAFEVINVGESRTISLASMVQALAEDLGVEPSIERLPMQPGDVRRTFADVRKAKELLGYEPRTDFRDGLRRFLAWLEAEGPGA